MVFISSTPCLDTLMYSIEPSQLPRKQYSFTPSHNARHSLKCMSQNCCVRASEVNLNSRISIHCETVLYFWKNQYLSYY